MYGGLGESASSRSPCKAVEEAAAKEAAEAEKQRKAKEAEEQKARDAEAQKSERQKRAEASWDLSGHASGRPSQGTL